MENKTKKCKYCGEVKPLSEFSISKGMRDGHLNKCKVCHRAYVKEHYKANREKYLQRSKEAYRAEGGREASVKAGRKYSNSPKGKAAKRRYYEKNREKVREYNRKWRREHRLQTRAHCAVYRALLRGDIEKKPCEVCGEVKVEAHHEDYNKPLDVKWLCNKHHKKLHRKKKNVFEKRLDKTN